jgi:hypothetical protein
MCSARDNAALPTLGFPIRASAGHRPFSASPRLIAAVHALHRLLVPRHPPCALTILTVISGSRRIASPDRGPDGPLPVIPVSLALCSFQGPRGGATRRPEPGTNGPRTPATRRSLKTQQHADARARAELARCAPPGSVDIPSPARKPTGSRARERVRSRWVSRAGCPGASGRPPEEGSLERR